MPRTATTTARGQPDAAAARTTGRVRDDRQAGERPDDDARDVPTDDGHEHLGDEDPADLQGVYPIAFITPISR